MIKFTGTKQTSQDSLSNKSIPESMILASFTLSIQPHELRVPSLRTKNSQARPKQMNQKSEPPPNVEGNDVNGINFVKKTFSEPFQNHFPRMITMWEGTLRKNLISN